MLVTILSSSVIIPDLMVTKQLVTLQIRAKHSLSHSKARTGWPLFPIQDGEGRQDSTLESRHKDGVSQGNTPKVQKYLLTGWRWCLLCQGQNHKATLPQLLCKSCGLHYQFSTSVPSSWLKNRKPVTQDHKRHLCYFFKTTLGLNITIRWFI